MSRKRTYKTTDIKHLALEQLIPLVVSGCVVAVDVAKQSFVLAIGTLAGELLRLVRFEHPTETRLFLAMLNSLRDGGSPPMVLFEPTGTYGDAIRARVHADGHAVFMVQPKHTHDAHELMDGVPSTHDPKAAATMLFLHANGHSRQWKPSDESRRHIKALLSRCKMHQRETEQRYGMLEALLQTHWPEFGRWLDPRQHRSAKALLCEFVCPADVASKQQEARALLRRASRNSLSPLLIDGFIADAEGSLGVQMITAERALMRELVEEITRHESAVDEIEKELEKLISSDAVAVRMKASGGVQLAAAICGLLGSPANYPSAAAILKAAGMNLRITQSGTEAYGIHLTKRGPAIVRQLLYLATLRWINSDPIARAWYRKRGSYTSDQKGAAVVALSRKLLAGLWRVAKFDETFDSTKLFDTRRLVLDNEPVDKPIRRRFPARTGPRPIARRGANRSRAGGVSM